MRSTFLLTALLLSSALAALLPVASANHCAQYALAKEVVCEADHVADPWVAFALCFYNTAPSAWLSDCNIVIADVDPALLP